MTTVPYEAFTRQLHAALAAMPKIPDGEYKLTVFQDSLIIEPIEPTTTPEPSVGIKS